MGAVELAIRDLDFEAEVQLEAVATIRLSGNADSTIVTQLTSLIAELHKRLVDIQASCVAIDIRSLEFMNASCFNIFVAWLNLINELPTTHRYKLQFSINPSIPWQTRSLRTLSCFATDLVQVTD